MARHKDVGWNLPDVSTWDAAKVAVLMDIRDELNALNRVMQCPNVIAGFRALSQINRRMGKFDALKLRKPK